MKKLLIVVVVALFVFGGGYGAYHGYLTYRQTRLVKKARASLDREKFAEARIYLVRALRANPGDLEAARLIAELKQKIGDPSELQSRKRIVEMAPNSLPDRLDLVETALRFGDLK